MSKLMPRGNLCHPLHQAPGAPLPDVLSIVIASTDDEPLERYSVYRFPGESDAAFLTRAQDATHEHYARFRFFRGVHLHAEYHLAPDPRKLLDRDYWFNARSRMLHTIQNEKASTDDRIDAMFDLTCLHGWLEPPGLLN